MSSIGTSYIDPKITKLVADVARDVIAEENSSQANNALVKPDSKDNFETSQSVFLKQSALKNDFNAGRDDQFLNAANVLSLKNAASQYYHQQIHAGRESANQGSKAQQEREAAKPPVNRFAKKAEKQLPSNKTTQNLASRGKGELSVQENGQFAWKMKNLELTGYIA